jgi:hypothetical protein
MQMVLSMGIANLPTHPCGYAHSDEMYSKESNNVVQSF